jgi:histone H3/H4
MQWRGEGERADTVAGRLARARGVIEGKFLELGRVLERSVEVVGGLISALDQLASVFDGAAAREAAGALETAAARLEGLAEARKGDQARFHVLADAAHGLDVRIADMQQALRYLRVFAVNIKVTAGGVPDAYDEFESFAQEVLSAITDGGGQLAEFGRDVDSLNAQVTAALGQEGELASRCAEVLPAVPRQLSEDAATLAEHHGRIAAAAAAAAQVAQSVQGKVGQALCSLQIGDTTRQRVEHVEAGLAILARGELGPGDAAVVLEMLAAQLDDTAEVFAHDVGRMAASAVGMADDAHEVLRLRDVVRGGHGRTQDAGVLARLERSLGQALRLVGDLATAEGSAQALTRSAQTTAGGLAERINSIRAIKTSIHQMALNAHLKCCRLGDAGRPLSVIAVELRVQADHLGETAEAAETLLASLARAAQADASDAGRVGSAAVGELLAQAAAPVRDASSRAGGELAGLVGQAEEIVSALQQATGRLNFRGEVEDVLRDMADQLRATAQAAEPASPTAALAATLVEIEGLYTMAKERQVHRSYAEGDVAAAA